MKIAILDKLPAPVRHFVIMVMGYVISVLTTIQSGDSVSLDAFLRGLLGIGAAQLILFITPITNQYGVGKLK
jgi:hypothetical protein